MTNHNGHHSHKTVANCISQHRLQTTVTSISARRTSVRTGQKGVNNRSGPGGPKAADKRPAKLDEPGVNWGLRGTMPRTGITGVSPGGRPRDQCDRLVYQRDSIAGSFVGFAGDTSREPALRLRFASYPSKVRAAEPGGARRMHG